MKMIQKNKTLSDVIRELPKSISFLELINKEFTEIPWDVEGIFESGTINMISAPPNQYKSWIVQHMAICMAKGEDVFGKFKTKQKGILIVNEEDNLRLLKDRSLMMINQKEDLNIYFLVGNGFKIDEITIFEILDSVRETNSTLVVFDSLRSIHTANENDSQEMQKVMDCFKRLTKHGITVLFTHHNRKKSKFPGSNKDDGSGEESRGSTAINAAIHGHLSCESIKREDGEYLIIRQQKLKCDKKMDPFLVKVEVDEEKNKMNFIYKGEYDSQEDSFRKNKELVLKIIDGSDRWLPKREIASFAECPESTTSKILQELEKDKLVITKTKKELEKDGVKLEINDLKHNAKFYFKNLKVEDDGKENYQAGEPFPF